MTSTYGDSFFDGAAMQAAKGPLIGGGLAKLTSIAIKKFKPDWAKYAGLAGAAVGGGVSAFLMTKPEHKETGAAGLATALLIGLSEQLETSMGLLRGADDLSAYASEMGADATEMLGDEVEGVDDLSATPEGLMIQGNDDLLGAHVAEIGAVTSEMGASAEGVQIQGLEGAFGGAF